MSTAFESWFGVVLLAPGFLALLLLVPIVVWLIRRRGSPSVPFAPAAFTVGLPGSWRARLRQVPMAMQVIGLCLIPIVLARPAEREQLPELRRGIDVLMCVDTSSSMATRDLDGRRTRLDVAIASAARFVSGRSSDRIGLLRFARYPDVLCPPTLDHAALKRFLDGVELTERDGPEDRTGIGTALARAAQVLRGSLAESKVVILLTDGEENVATAGTPAEIGPLRAARICEGLGVRVYTVVVGTGKPGPSGSVEPLDTRQVERVAEVTGGRFFAARDADALAAVYASIDELEKVPFEQARYVWHDRFLPFLVVVLALMLVGRVLGSSLLGGAP